MKKGIAALLFIVLAFSVFAPFAMAATKDDILGEVKKSIYKNYLSIQMENSIRAIPLTAAQGDKLLDIVKRGIAYLPNTREPSAHAYTEAQMIYILALVDEACTYMGFTYDFKPSANPKHINDIVFRVYDQSGNVVFEYDGDLIKKTDAPANTSQPDSNAVYLVLGSALILLAASGIFISKKAKISLVR